MKQVVSGLIKDCLGSIGTRLPEKNQLQLAQRHRWLRYLLLKKPEFRFDNYLDDMSIMVNPRNGIELECVSGHYEPIVDRVISEFVHEGDVCIDVGANVGAVTLAMAKQKGRVYAIEPGSPFFKRLKRNIELNPSLSEVVSCHQIGLASKEGTLEWSQDPDNLENGGFIPHAKKEIVVVKTLDQFVHEQTISKVNFIKVDTEGMELEVMRGALQTIERDRPTLLLETLMNFDGRDKKRKQLCNWLQLRGYRILDAEFSSSNEVQYPHLPANVVCLPSVSS